MHASFKSYLLGSGRSRRSLRRWEDPFRRVWAGRNKASVYKQTLSGGKQRDEARAFWATLLLSSPLLSSPLLSSPAFTPAPHPASKMREREGGIERDLFVLGLLFAQSSFIKPATNELWHLDERKKKLKNVTACFVRCVYGAGNDALKRNTHTHTKKDCWLPKVIFHGLPLVCLFVSVHCLSFRQILNIFFVILFLLKLGLKLQRPTAVQYTEVIWVIKGCNIICVLMYGHICANLTSTLIIMYLSEKDTVLISN